MINSIIKPNVILGYALTVRDKITLTELEQMKKKIREINPDGLFVDLDTSLIYKAEKDYPDMFRVVVENDEIVVYAKEKYKLDFLNTCNRYLFHSYDEFEKVKKIMLTV